MHLVLGLGLGNGSGGALPLAGLWTAYWDADHGVASSGSEVTGWASRVGAYTWAPPGAARPTWSADGYAGRAGIRWTSADSELLRCDALAPLFVGEDIPVTICAQVQFITLAAQATVFKVSTSSGSFNRYHLDGFSATQLLLIKSDAGATQSRLWTTADLTTQGRTIITSDTGTAQSLYVDNVLNGTVGAINVGTCTPTVGYLGSFGSAQYANMIMRRIGLIVGTAIDATQAATVYAAWNNR